MKKKYEQKIVELVEKGEETGIVDDLLKAFPELAKERALKLIWLCVDRGIIGTSVSQSSIKGSVK